MSFLKSASVSLLPLIALAVSATAPAFAEETKSEFEAALAATKPIFDVRARLETVEQTGIADDATALTYRLRAGFETGAFRGSKLLVEFDHIDDLVDDFNSTINGKTMYPVVADPNATELNRLQLTNTSFPDTKITLGRQRIILDNARFVGNVGWRQNEQTYDALRVENSSFGELKIDISYIDQINRIFGDESPVGRWDSESFLINLSHPTPIGTVTGFAYLLDIEDGSIFSSETYGVRLTGKREVGSGSLAYSASVATQGDYADSPVSYEADYLQAEGIYSYKDVNFGVGYERLGGDDMRGFQTPLATLHAFQGWTDKFLATPAAGVEDIYAKAGYKIGDAGFLKGLNVNAFYHDLSADIGGSDYGSEFGLVAAASIDKVKLTFKYADYNADGFATDTTKFWFQLDFAL